MDGVLLNTLCFERDGRVIGSVEEISGSQMVVALLDACIHAFHLDRSTCSSDRSIIHQYFARKFLELSFHIVDSEVSHEKRYARVGRVDFVGTAVSVAVG